MRKTGCFVRIPRAELNLNSQIAQRYHYRNRPTELATIAQKLRESLMIDEFLSQSIEKGCREKLDRRRLLDLLPLLVDVGP